MTTAETLALDWMYWLRDLKNKSPQTLRRYKQTIVAWLEWSERKDVDPLDPHLTDLEAFVARKPRGRVRAPATKRADTSALRGWYDWLHVRDHISMNPTVDFSGPPRTHSTGRPVEDADWQRMWGSDLSKQMRAIMALGFFVGLRAGEIHALDPANITPTRLRVVRKGGAEEVLPWRDMAEVHMRKLPHLLPNVEPLVSAMEHARHGQSVTPWAHSQEFGRVFEKLCARVGVDKYTPHQLRHSCATNLLRANVPPHNVMRLMGHASFDTTMGYVRVQADDLRLWLDAS